MVGAHRGLPYGGRAGDLPGKHRRGRCLACWPGTRPTWCRSSISPTRWNDIARPALLMPSSGRASSLSVCGLP